MDTAEVSAHAGKLLSAAELHQLFYFTGLLDVGEVSHKTLTILAELLLKTPQEP